MPLNVAEAARVFQRRAEDILETAEAIKMGVNLVNMQGERIHVLENLLRQHKIPVPGEPVQPGAQPRLPEAKPANPEAPAPDNVTPIKQPDAAPATDADKAQ